MDTPELLSSAPPSAVVMQPGHRERYDDDAADQSHDVHRSLQLDCCGAANAPAATASNVRFAARVLGLAA
jgi:hypothetical protein